MNAAPWEAWVPVAFSADDGAWKFGRVDDNSNTVQRMVDIDWKFVQVMPYWDIYGVDEEEANPPADDGAEQRETDGDEPM